MAGGLDWVIVRENSEGEYAGVGGAPTLAPGGRHGGAAPGFRFIRLRLQSSQQLEFAEAGVADRPTMTCRRNGGAQLCSAAVEDPQSGHPEEIYPNGFLLSARV